MVYHKTKLKIADNSGATLAECIKILHDKKQVGEVVKK